MEQYKLRDYFLPLMRRGASGRRRQSSAGFGSGRRLAFEVLEGRELLATFTVTNLNDAPVNGAEQAPGTLRQAIFDANSTALVADVIQFAAGLSGTIQVSVVGDSGAGNSAFVVTSTITIRGNANGITIGRAGAAPEMRLFRVTDGDFLTLESINVMGGVARGSAGGPGSNGGDGRGGAVLNEGRLDVVASTFYDNRAIGGAPGSGGVAGAGLGGAIYSDDATLIIRNSTLTGNQALNGFESTVSSAFGGGIYGVNGNLAIHNSTITNSSALTGRGLYFVAVGQTANATIHSTIIGQSDTQVYDLFASYDAGGTVDVMGDKNLIRWQNDFAGITVSNADPRLNVLANYGGPTLTHALQGGSAAIDKGSNLLNLTTDQRGASFSRDVGAGVDIGAFESSVIAPELRGDYNRDTAVDAADYVVWRKFLGGDVVPYALADGDGSGEIDALDHDVWTESFGAATPPSAPGVAVPVDAAARESGSRPRKIMPREGWFADDDVRDEALLSLLTAWDGVARGGASRLDWGGGFGR